MNTFLTRNLKSSCWLRVTDAGGGQAVTKYMSTQVHE